MDLTGIRRDLHQHPEVGFTEFRTASFVVEQLTALGYQVIYGQDAMDGESRQGLPTEQVLEEAFERAIKDGANPDIAQKMKGGYTAVIGILKGKEDGPTVACRFDMDALPVKESMDHTHLPQKEGFRSQYEGNMHACGHDGHTAMGLGVAEELAKGDFSGTLKLIFQPAEEGVRGARSIVEKGVLDDVDYIFSQHLGTGVPTGEFNGGANGFLATTKMAAHFFGESAHAGSDPEKGKNALLGAATALLNIHAISRFSSGDTRINVGILEGGTGANIIPDYARMVIETRGVTEAINSEVSERVQRIIATSAAMHELDYKIEIMGQAIPMTCDEDMIQLAMEEASKVEGITSVKPFDENGTSGSEDFSLMLKRVQENGGKGTYMIIGADIAAPHHHPRFDYPEEALPIGVEVMTRLARRMLS